MTRIESAKTIEETVGARRHAVDHIGRAVSAEQRVYILHSSRCLVRYGDLRECPYSLALDRGIDVAEWEGFEDQPVKLWIRVKTVRLMPARMETAVHPAPSPIELAERVAFTIETAQLQYVTEADLQGGILQALAAAGISAAREVRLSGGGSRIDLMAGDVGIEVKIAGRSVTVARQLARYASCPEVGALVLVTTRADHDAVPAEINGKPVVVCSLIGGGL